MTRIAQVMEFLRILEEYRVKCEEGGDYLEAGRAQRQLDVLRRQETRRQQKAVRARQLCERQDVQVLDGTFESRPLIQVVRMITLPPTCPGTISGHAPSEILMAHSCSPLGLFASQVAHNMQFQDFNAAWNKYLEEYDRMAQVYVQQMTERHAVALMEHQRKLQQELRDKPPKWSKVVTIFST